LCHDVPFIFKDCEKLLDIGGNWNTLSYTSIQSIPNMLNSDMSGDYAGHGRTGTEDDEHAEEFL
jgi:hypothetical protein